MPITFRTQVVPSDVAAIPVLAKEVGIFQPFEIEVITTLVEEKLEYTGGEQYYIIAEEEGQLLGYICYVPIVVSLPGHAYEFYWLMVHPKHQGRGIGSQLVQRALAEIKAAGGEVCFAQTSSRAVYEGSRKVHLKNGFDLVAALNDYFGPSDHQQNFQIYL